MSNADNALRERLASKLAAEEGDTTDGSTEREAMHGEDHDEDGDEDEDGMEMDMDGGEMSEAMQMIAEAAAEDVTPAQVQEMLAPLLEGEDTRDAETELAAESESESEADADAAPETETETESEAESVTKEDVSEMIDDKLEGVVDSLAAETREVVQKANTAQTPTPSAGSGETNLSASDLLSDEHTPAAMRGGDE